MSQIFTATVSASQEGFAAVANAFSPRYPRLAQNHVLPNESQKDFEELVDSLLARHSPLDQSEREFVESLAGHHWTLIRIAGILRRDRERAVRVEDQLLRRLSPGAIDKLNRYRKSVKKSIAFTLRALALLQAGRAPGPGTEQFPAKPTSKIAGRKAPAK